MPRSVPQPCDASDLANRYAYGELANQHGIDIANQDQRFTRYAAMHRSEQRKMRRLPQVINLKEFAKYRAIPTADGRGLPWTVLARLISIKDPTERLQMARQAARERWSVTHLGLQMRIRMPLHTRGAGRPITTPECPEEAAALLIGALDRLLRVAKIGEAAKVVNANADAKRKVSIRLKQVASALHNLIKLLPKSSDDVWKAPAKAG